MNEDRQIEILIEQAEQRRLAHDFVGAIDLARRALALDPDRAIPHASLALSLVEMKRLHGAHLEVSIALLLDGNDPFVHYAAAVIRTAQRDLVEAWRHVAVALDVESASVDVRVLGARIRSLQGRHADARELVEEALAIDGQHVGALIALARLELALGNHVEAATQIDIALTADPASIDAHLVAGSVALARGDVTDAEEHARFILGERPGDTDAMELWTGIKARKNPFLGLWWRFNALVARRSERSQVVVLGGSFLIANIIVILAGAFGFDWLETAVFWAWTGFCGYTWVAPTVFRWMMDRELGKVVLRPDF